ncbi:MAG: tRNA epoxyqueuosine(34) reductase QueG [Candidatus Cloacimonetes bacterium]|nr:tRNA epoxyqueuosine(34) reductase QueG [Candidatus Cloacimonadota bacterium]
MIDQGLLNDLIQSYGFLEYDHISFENIPKNDYLKSWMEDEKYGEMQWMANTFDKRLDIKSAYSEYKSVILVLLPYYSKEAYQASLNNHISLYSQGRDYHKVLWKSLKKLYFSLKETYPDIEGKWYCDTGPISEKFVSSYSKLGWIGKSTNFINKNYGSYFFLGSLMINYDGPNFSLPSDHCGTCTRCIDACPTDAITEAYKMDPTLCISYQSIEQKSIPELADNHQTSWIYGCDDCQTCCPYNRFATDAGIQDFLPRDNYNDESFLELTPETFLKFFEGSPIRRIGFEKFLENVILSIYRRNKKSLYPKIVSLKDSLKNQRIHQLIDQINF